MKAAETQGNGAVFAAEAVETQCKCAALAATTMEMRCLSREASGNRRLLRLWKHKAEVRHCLRREGSRKQR